MKRTMNLLRWMVQRRLCARYLMASGRRDSEEQGPQEKANEMVFMLQQVRVAVRLATSRATAFP
jgi:hypothetical protein